MLNFLKNTLYIRLQPERISILHVESGREIHDIPVIAISKKNGKRIVAAIGKEALSLASIENLELAYGFKHPRTLIADFTIAQETLRLFVKKSINKGLSLSTAIILHPLDEQEGGFTQIELKALLELALSAGAKKVFIWQGKELYTHELSKLIFPLEKGKLLSA